jgi:hypothetical protein
MRSVGMARAARHASGAFLGFAPECRPAAWKSTGPGFELVRTGGTCWSAISGDPVQGLGWQVLQCQSYS